MRKRNVPGGAAGPQTRLGALRASGWVRLPFSSAFTLCSLSALGRLVSDLNDESEKQYSTH